MKESMVSFLIKSYNFCMHQELLYTSTEINLLLLEIRRCQDVLDKIKDMRAGQLGTALVDVMDEVRWSTKIYFHKYISPIIVLIQYRWPSNFQGEKFLVGTKAAKQKVVTGACKCWLLVAASSCV